MEKMRDMNSPILSIIIPVHKDSFKLVRLLSSLYHGSNVSEFEVIIVLDNQLLDMSSIREQFPLVTIIPNARNRGAGGARNTGLDTAKGAYVLFADSDDVLLPGWLKTVSETVKSGHFDVVYFLPTSFYEGNLASKAARSKRYARLVNNFVVNENMDIRYYFYVPWSKLIRREFLFANHIRFEEIRASNDLNFSLQVGLKAKTLNAVKVPIYSVEQSSSSMTRSDTVESLCCRIDALFRFNQTLRQFGLPSKTLMMGPWLLKLFFRSPLHAIKYLVKGISKRTPVIFDHRFKR